MLPLPKFFLSAFAVSSVLNVIFGLVCSVPSLWSKWFPVNKLGQLIEGSYLKAGEYGEADYAPHSWSPFKEPVNAWTSLSYSIFGGVIIYTGIHDFLQKYSGVIVADNILSENPEFSIMFGLSAVYLGLASFLFHASHSEVFRKADAGMTSGVIIAPLMLGVWDRARPPSTSTWVMITIAVIIQFSLTHGYLPYGSSDVLLPTLIICCWTLELVPRYQGPVDWKDEKILWLRCAYCALGGMLLRLADVKRKNIPFFRNAIRGFFLITLFPFAFFLHLGFRDPAIILGLLSGSVVYFLPSRGHLFWHFFSSFALFVWWLNFRIRPGDPPLSSGRDSEVIAMILFIALKNAVRRIFMLITPPESFTQNSKSLNLGQNSLGYKKKESGKENNKDKNSSKDLKDRIMILMEHVFFVVWGYYVIIKEPNSHGLNGSWYFNTKLFWSQPLFPSEGFHLFYLMKAGSHCEDVLFFLITSYMEKKSKNGKNEGNNGNIQSNIDEEQTLLRKNSRESIDIIGNNHSNNSNNSSNSSNSNIEKHNDKNEENNDNQPPVHDTKMAFHHFATATLCLLSYYCGYVKIGSVIMLIHDVSDIPLDLVRISTIINNKLLQVISYIMLVVCWIYFRLWVFPFVVMGSIVQESKSILADSECEIGYCTWSQVPERSPFLLLLGVLLVLHILWFVAIIKKGYREILMKGDKDKLEQ